MLVSPFILFYFPSVVCSDGKIHNTVIFFCQPSLVLVFWPGLSNLYVSQIYEEFDGSH